MHNGPPATSGMPCGNHVTIRFGTHPVASAGFNHAYANPRKGTSRWASGCPWPPDRSVRHHRVPSPGHLVDFGADGTVADENEPYRSGTANHRQDTDATSRLLGCTSPASCCLAFQVPTMKIPAGSDQRIAGLHAARVRCRPVWLPRLPGRAGWGAVVGSCPAHGLSPGHGRVSV